MAKKIIIANWKMNPKTVKEAESLFAGVKRNALKFKNVETVTCPPNIHLKSFAAKSSGVIIGAQDVSIYPGIGARTGEVSVEMLKNIGVKYAILGHSERRESGESDSEINKKIKNVLDAGLKAILCVGEKERGDNGDFMKVVELQLVKALDSVEHEKNAKNLVIAYEPVWAISKSGKFATNDADMIFGMTIFIRKTLGYIFGEDVAKKIPIIYGGSVTPETAKDFLENGGVRGLLVGSKSLIQKDFTEILKAANEAKNSQK